MKTLLLAVTALAAVAAYPASALRPVPPLPVSAVPCADVIGAPKFPYVVEADYRLVLSAVSVPPAYQPPGVDTKDPYWPYWWKAGMIVRSGISVTVTVPKAWRKRAAITWGNGYVPASRELRFAACGTDRALGNAWPGGFVLRSPTGCLPLIFRVGKQTQTVWFGLGKHC